MDHNARKRIIVIHLEGIAVKIADLFSVEGFGVLITGGASGIGLGFAEAMAANGARVTILDVNPQALEYETKRLQSEGFDVRGQVVDVPRRPRSGHATVLELADPGPLSRLPLAAPVSRVRSALRLG